MLNRTNEYDKLYSLMRTYLLGKNYKVEHKYLFLCIVKIKLFTEEEGERNPRWRAFYFAMVEHGGESWEHIAHSLTNLRSELYGLWCSLRNRGQYCPCGNPGVESPGK